MSNFNVPIQSRSEQCKINNQTNEIAFVNY